MNRPRNILLAIRERIIPILASVPLIALGIFAILEYVNKINYLNIQFPLDSTEFGQLSGAFISIFLTYALVILYWQQKRVQENQQELLEQQHEPHLSGEVATLHIVSAQFRIRNTGSAPAYEVEANWEIAGQSRTWEIPTLVPGESFGFPILVDDNDNWLLNTEEIDEYLQDKGTDGKISYTISCTNPQNETRTFEGIVDFSILSKRSEANELWETEPLEEISNEIGKMRKDIRKISRYTEKEKKEVNWQVRTTQTELILRYIREFGPLDVEELQELTGISEHDLRRKIERLNELGEIDHEEKTDTLKIGPSSGPNRTIDDDYN